MRVNSIENELIILTKQTVDIFLKSNSPADVMALYTFYYYTAKWQETNQPKCTTGYAAQGLKWSETKIRKVKKELIALGLIEDVQQKDASGKICGHFIKLNYVIKQSTLQANHTAEKPQGGEIESVECLGTNALSNNNINALSANNKNALSEDIEMIVSHLNAKANKKFRSETPDTKKHIKARLSEGFTIDDFKTVIDKKCAEWLGTDMEQYLRPQTLFGTKFESYLNAPSKARKGRSGVAIKENAEDDLAGIL